MISLKTTYIRPALAIILAGMALVCRGEIYPETSYTLQGRKLMSWHGPERSIDMAGDPALSRVNAIADFAFAGSGLEEITLPTPLRVIPIGAFEGCTSLERVYMGPRTGFIREGAFARCKSLKELRVPQGLLYIGPSAFEESGLQRIDLSETSCFEYGDRAFAACPTLSEIYLAQTQPLALGYDILRDCPALQSVTIPDAWTEVPQGMLAGATSLTSAHIGGSVTHIADSAFADCPALRELAMGLRVESIGRDAFANDESLRLLYLPADLRKIDDGAFAGCGSLEWVFCGADLREIGDGAFAGCYNLRQIEIQAVNPPENWPGTFTGADTEAVALAVPSEAEDAYRQAPGWRQFNIQSTASVKTPLYPQGVRSAIYSLDGRRVEIPKYAGELTPHNLGGFVPPGFYILCRPGMTPEKIIIR